MKDETNETETPYEEQKRLFDEAKEQKRKLINEETLFLKTRGEKLANQLSRKWWRAVLTTRGLDPNATPPGPEESGVPFRLLMRFKPTEKKAKLWLKQGMEKSSLEVREGRLAKAEARKKLEEEKWTDPVFLDPAVRKLLPPEQAETMTTEQKVAFLRKVEEDTISRRLRGDIPRKLILPPGFGH